jgi:colicin import membrane protein
MTNQLVKVDPKEFGLEDQKANELTSGLTTILAEREVLKAEFLEVSSLEITEDNLDTFKKLRLRIRDNRTKGIEKWHKANKEFFLTGGRFVDAIKNKEVIENEAMENKLEAAEKHFENLEKIRIKAVHYSRVSILLPFGYDIGAVDFGMMDENMFNAILTGAKKNHEDRIEAERKADEARLEAIRIEAEEREKQRIEMERLRTENEAKEKALEAERKSALEAQAKADADRKALEAKAQKEREEATKLAKAEADKQAKILAEQKAKADKLAAELKAKADAEAKAEVDRIAAEKKAAKSPDKEKLKSALNSVLFPVLDMKTAEGHKLYTLIQDQSAKFQAWANTQIEQL